MGNKVGVKKLVAIFRGSYLGIHRWETPSANHRASVGFLLAVLAQVCPGLTQLGHKGRHMAAMIDFVCILLVFYTIFCGNMYFLQKLTGGKVARSLPSWTGINLVSTSCCNSLKDYMDVCSKSFNFSIFSKFAWESMHVNHEWIYLFIT